jgi:hypothetical protein
MVKHKKYFAHLSLFPHTFTDEPEPGPNTYANLTLRTYTPYFSQPWVHGHVHTYIVLQRCKALHICRSSGNVCMLSNTCIDYILCRLNK